MSKDFGAKKWIQLHFKIKVIRKPKRLGQTRLTDFGFSFKQK